MLLVLLIATGCSTYASDRYSVSMDSHEELKQIAASLQGDGLSVGSFTATEPGRIQIGCRAVGPIKTPDGETFEEFIREALIDQLQLADLYAPKSTQRISANLDTIDFDSAEGLWSLAVTVTNSAGNSYKVREDYNYSSSFYGETACNQTAQAFMPAVQNLIRKVIRHQVFQGTVASSR